jgi:invasion protein IalB
MPRSMLHVCEPSRRIHRRHCRDSGRRHGLGRPDRGEREAPPAAWRVECSGDGKTLECRAVQQVYHRESRQLLVSLAVKPAADGKTGAMIVQLPLGLNLTEPIMLKVDNGAPEKQAIQTCTNVGCFIAMTINDKLLAAMRTGSELKVTMQDANKKPVDIGLPLLGFGLAFDKAK